MRSNLSLHLKRERLHARVEPGLLGKVRRIAKRRRTTLTQLIEQGLRFIVQADEAERSAATPKVIDAEQI